MQKIGAQMFPSLPFLMSEELPALDITTLKAIQLSQEGLALYKRSRVLRFATASAQVEFHQEVGSLLHGKNFFWGG